MPHFIIECSENVLPRQSAGVLMDAVYETAEASGLFAPGDIKVRLQPFSLYRIDSAKNDFLHVFGWIMQGRSTAQKAALSEAITRRLSQLLPDIAILAVNIAEFEKATYCNKAMLHPLNTGKDRHFEEPG